MKTPYRARHENPSSTTDRERLRRVRERLDTPRIDTRDLGLTPGQALLWVSPLLALALFWTIWLSRAADLPTLSSFLVVVGLGAMLIGGGWHSWAMWSTCDWRDGFYLPFWTPFDWHWGPFWCARHEGLGLPALLLYFGFAAWGFAHLLAR